MSPGSPITSELLLPSANERLSVLSPTAVHFLEMISQSDALVAVYDSEDRLRYSNTAFQKAYVVDPTESVTWEDLIRRNHAAQRGTILGTDNVDAWVTSEKSIRRKTESRQSERDLFDGRWLFVTETQMDDGWCLFVATDVSSLRTSHHSLRQARDQALKSSQTDDLTGIANRRYILEQLDRVIGQADRVDSSVCLLDIDHFKQVNDTLGHQAGDNVLVAFARTVQRTIRPRDCFGRFGGEEFLLIFTDVAREEATLRLQEVLDAVSDMIVDGTPDDFRITCSAGMSPAQSADTGVEILKRCDIALYVAKDRGRNRFMIKLA